MLAELNRTFYIRFADDFSRTRQGWPPGFERILPHFHPATNVLDVGCGNGRLLMFLVDHGWGGNYLGLDHSAELLASAVEGAGRVTGPASLRSAVHFAQADLLEPALVENARLLGASRGFPGAFDTIACLAVLHHIPGADERSRLIANCSSLLTPGGALIISTWQFLGAPRLRSRILPWTTVGLQDNSVEPGDYLIGWGRGVAGRRYCAAIGEAALVALASKAGLVPADLFYADGHEGNLNLYGVFTAT